MKEGDLDGTLSLLEKNIAVYTGHPMEQEMLCMLANLYAHRLNDTTAAQNFADRAASINPGCRFLDTAYRSCGIAYNSAEFDDLSIGVSRDKPASSNLTVETAATPTRTITPNPANPFTTIQYTLAKPGNVSLDIYSVSGQKVATLVDGAMTAGTHSAVFDGSSLASGIYLYRFRTAGFAKSGKIALVK